VEKVDINADSFMKVVFTSPLPPKQARDILDDQVVRQLTRVTGVAEVDLAGGQEREIHLLLDPRALKSYGVSIQRVAALIAANNVTNPSGYIAQGDREIPPSRESPRVQPWGPIRGPFKTALPCGLSPWAHQDASRTCGPPLYDGRRLPDLLKARPNANVVNEAGRAQARTGPPNPSGRGTRWTCLRRSVHPGPGKNVLRTWWWGPSSRLLLYLFLAASPPPWSGPAMPPPFPPHLAPSSPWWGMASPSPS
jgi:HAE1 family hydrophobic/amphiphilic exporter-1